MSQKRTFGLVGDYGDSSDSEVDSEGEEGGKRARTEVAEVNQEKEVEKTEESPAYLAGFQGQRWDHVRQEYEGRELMFKYTQVGGE